MRARTSTWFETRVKYDKMDDKGVLRPVKEMYVFDSLSFSEAETKTIDELSAFIAGEYVITDITIGTYKEIVFSDNKEDFAWFKVKMQTITLDEKTEKEKFTTSFFLVQSDCLRKAVKYFDDFMSKSMLEYKIVSVQETSILDVYEHPNTTNTNKD